MRPTTQAGPTTLTGSTRRTRAAIAGLAIALVAFAAPVLAQAQSPASAATPAPARAQSPVKPARLTTDAKLPVLVLDARGVFARLGQDLTTAAGLSTSPFSLPAKALGGVGGVQLYLLRGRSMALGVGGEAILARARHELTDSEGKPTGTVILRRLRGVSGQASLNFGHRAGWSYITAGMGPTSFESYLEGVTPDGLRVTSLNFGGGARWFNLTHLAFTVDLRIYQTKIAAATPNTAARDRKSVWVFSGGLAIK